VIASRTLRHPPRKHFETLPVPPATTGNLVVAGSSFNIARQRSDLTEVEVLGL
jgi:hypothetical protein